MDLAVCSRETCRVVSPAVAHGCFPPTILTRVFGSHTRRENACKDKDSDGFLIVLSDDLELYVCIVIMHCIFFDVSFLMYVCL
jgi:hypothetical protein